MAFADTNAGKQKKPLSPDINFVDIVRVSSPEYAIPEDEISPIAFYCKQCKKLTEVEKHPKKLLFKCQHCKQSFNESEVVFGTHRALKSVYKLI